MSKLFNMFDPEHHEKLLNEWIYHKDTKKHKSFFENGNVCFMIHCKNRQEQNKELALEILQSMFVFRRVKKGPSYHIKT